MAVSFRSKIAASLEQLASEVAVQRMLDYPPEEFRLEWEDSYCVLTGQQANEAAVASFSAIELDELRTFNAFIWQLPPEPDPMWHRDNLDHAPWPEVRLRARQLLQMLRSGKTSG